MKNEFENMQIIFNRKRYEIDDWQCEDRAVGIMSGYFIFGEEGLTMNMPYGYNAKGILDNCGRGESYEKEYEQITEALDD